MINKQDFFHILTVPMNIRWCDDLFDNNEWLKNRIELFKNITLKSILNQKNKNFECWLFFCKDLCREEDLKMGDIIFAEYLPDSQKYIYAHFPEYGTVQEIGEDNTKTKVEVTILNHNGDLVKINKDPLSIYSRGYCLFLKKYKSNYKELPYPINDFSCTTCGRDHTED